MHPVRSSVRAAVIASTLGAALLATRPAHAFCRIASAEMPADFKQDQACFMPDGAKELFWRNACVGYSLQRDASQQVTLDQATAAVARAFAKWSSVVCADGGHPSIAPDDLGPVECSAVQYNETQPNQHVIIFRDDVWPYAGDTFNTLGLTRMKFDKDTGEIFDADMEINAADHTLIVAGTPQPGEYLLDNVLTHEVGHFLGLAHSTDPQAIMFALYHGESSQLSADDVTGICTIYPSAGQRATSDGPVNEDPCDPTPRHGFASACGSPDGGIVVTETVVPMHRSSCSVSRLGSSPEGLPFLGGIVCAQTVWQRRTRRTKALRTQVTIKQRLRQLLMAIS